MNNLTAAPGPLRKSANRTVTLANFAARIRQPIEPNKTRRDSLSRLELEDLTSRSVHIGYPPHTLLLQTCQKENCVRGNCVKEGITMQPRVIEYTDDQLSWSYDSTIPTLPVPYRGYARTLQVDPFPCYAHPRAEVEKALARAHAAFPLGNQVMCLLLPFEMLGRTNGHAQYDQTYENGKYTGIELAIVLSGKRIPHMPAMTRYLCSHEYGHCVQHWIEWKRGTLEKEPHLFEQEYAKLRGVEFSNAYGGRNWHTNTGEIVVNDFRILMTGSEPEFWPHPVPHPLEVPRLKYFWQEMAEKFAVRETVNVACAETLKENAEK